MKAFRCLIPEGNAYKIKQFFSFHHLILCIWLLIGLAILQYSGHTKTGITIIIIAVLFIFFLLLKPSKIRVYPDDKMLQVDVPGRGLYQDRFYFNQIQGFELQTIEMARIPLGAYLYIKIMDDNGKEGKHVMGSAFGKRRMQELSNELDQIFKP